MWPFVSGFSQHNVFKAHPYHSKCQHPIPVYGGIIWDQHFSKPPKPDAGGPPARRHCLMPTFPISQKQEQFGREVREEIGSRHVPLNQDHLPQHHAKGKNPISLPFPKTATWDRDARRG